MPMLRYELVFQDGQGTAHHVDLSEAGLLIGRGVDCDVRLNDGRVSRKHARLFFENDAPVVEDVGSRNGILINGQKRLKSPLCEGDTLQIGDTLCHLVKRPDSTLGQTVISPEKAALLQSSIMGEASGARLPVLYRAAQLLGTVFDLDALLSQILELIFEALPVQRGFVLFCNERAQLPEIRASLSRDTTDTVPPVSHTLIQHVVAQKEAVLTLNAQEDSRFDQAESIMCNAISSAMCAPLCGRESVIGVLYVDSGPQPTAFSAEELGLLTAIAQVVGVAVENARLYQEKIVQERLAAIGEATAGLGHCIKNVLTGLRGGSDLINRAVEKQNLNLLERGWPLLKRAIERVDSLVLNILTVARDREPECMPYDVTQLLRETAEVILEKAQQANVELRFATMEGGRIDVDAREIYRVLLNLVTNALEACEEKGGTVTLSCQYTKDGCFCIVEDTGPGIPEAVRPKLFNAFFTTKQGTGTGLGLACSRKIVEEHGGSITVSSEEGTGTTFTVFLPYGSEGQSA